jgi:probable rRNA maturation factor
LVVKPKPATEKGGSAAVHVTRKGGRADGVTVALVRARAKKMLEFLDLGRSELSILLTDDPTIHELNRSFRKKDRPTDVLAFAMREGEAMPGSEGAEILGDVVISLDTAARQSAGRRRDPLSEVTMLLAHGLLHLLGYDHETDEEEAEMKARTRVLVRAATSEKTGQKRALAGRPSHKGRGA